MKGKEMKCQQCNGTGFRTIEIPELTKDFDLFRFVEETPKEELREIIRKAQLNRMCGSKRWRDRVFASLSV